MKTTHIFSRWGGQIIEVTEVCHNTDDGVGCWYFAGVSQFNNGSIENPDWSNPKEMTFDPGSVYCDSTNPEAKEEMDKIMAAMNAYLLDAGAWHTMKHKRDGRCYSWTPKKPKGAAKIEDMIAKALKAAA